MKNLEKSRELLQQQIATAEAQLAQLKAQLEQTERQIAAENAVSSRVKEDNKRDGERTRFPVRKYPLEQDEYRRYGRQMIVEQMGIEGQLKLRGSSVLIVGAGGLGCPAALYLAGAGVGTIGIVDGDTVEVSNLHRQVLHRTRNVGKYKVDSAIEYLKELNPHPTYIPHRSHLTAPSAPSIFASYDLILDCTDNPATRYLISDTAVLTHKPLVSASALRTEGQLMVLNYPSQTPETDSSSSDRTTSGPCYRCIFPIPPPANSITSCADGGILGPVVGVMGVLQALEAIRVLTHTQQQTNSNSSNSIVPTLHLFSAYSSPPFRSIRLRPRRKDCVACSTTGARTITLESLKSGSMDYVLFCGGVGAGNMLGGDERVGAGEFWGRYREALTRAETEKDGKGDEHEKDGEQQQPILVDVREAVQYNMAALRGSVNIPMSQILASPLPSAMADASSSNPLKFPSWYPSALLDAAPTRPIHVVCRLGNDSQVVVRRLKEMGVDRGGSRWVGDIKGGLRAWREEVEPEFPDY
ncbi:hypothetical protein AJ79_06684 [Helicocarpus griseus UAMH5409]|uniref:Adenylyltransferase and sulfurtransferase uba4 n=1 Tax=Helicocarpus griseus UAMH5409 TaxID=1447875 RepID=A0A2B7XAT7_9EURO|nr:hypothetical protein AJ79_06684 [Helicocarpus griseus UAMH5409]